jgi:hypothetical protein
MQNLIASWQEASAASQQLVPDVVGRQLLTAALNTNPAPHEIPPWPRATLAIPARRRNLNIANTYSIVAEDGINFYKKSAAKKYTHNRKCPQKQPAVLLAMRPNVRVQVSVLLAAVAVSRHEVAPKNAVAPAKI